MGCDNNQMAESSDIEFQSTPQYRSDFAKIVIFLIFPVCALFFSKSGKLSLRKTYGRKSPHSLSFHPYIKPQPNRRIYPFRSLDTQ